MKAPRNTGSAVMALTCGSMASHIALRSAPLSTSCCAWDWALFVGGAVPALVFGVAFGNLFLGLPFNIASYALLTQMVAQSTDLEPGDLVISLGDAHIYSNHLEAVKTQLGRTPRALPTLRLDPSVKSVFDFRYEHFHLDGYDPHPKIAAPIAV